MLFDKDGIYNIKDEYNFGLDFINNGGYKNKFLSLDDAYKYGCILSDEVSIYKEPCDIKVNNEIEKDLMHIRKLEFYINDLNLYLDLYDDMDALKLFNKYSEELNKCKSEFSNKYYQLCLDNLNKDYTWNKTIFPWEDIDV